MNCLPPLTAPSAVQAYYDPSPYVIQPGVSPVGYTLFHFLLPYVEEDAVYRALNPTANYAGIQYDKTIKVYTSPADPSISRLGRCQTPYGGANGWGACNYAGNYNVFGDPNKPTWSAMQGSRSLGNGFADGTSNTIMFANIYATCGWTNDINFCYGSLWADSNSIWRAAFCTNTSYKDPAGSGYTRCLHFQVMPNWLTQCDPARAQSFWLSGINVGMADGSARHVSANVSDTTWANACDPQDGGPLGTDW